MADGGLRAKLDRRLRSRRLPQSAHTSCPAPALLTSFWGFGVECAGSLCFGESNRKDFMTPLFRQYKAMPESRGRVTPHIKCFTRHRDSHLAWYHLSLFSSAHE